MSAVLERAPASRRVYRRRRDAKLTRDKVRAAWKLYEAGHSVRGIAAMIWRQFGYASAQSCAVVLHKSFRLEGYRLRDRIEATRAASTIHGLSPRSGRGAAYNSLRRQRSRERGETRGVRCAGTRKRDGAPCGLAALAGLDYCIGHDPSRAEQRNQHLARLRERRDG